MGCPRCAERRRGRPVSYTHLDVYKRQNLHGGSASVDELNALDGKKTARQLIESGSGTVTPYGVVYDNGMKLEPVSYTHLDVYKRQPPYHPKKNKPRLQSLKIATGLT